MDFPKTSSFERRDGKVVKTSSPESRAYVALLKSRLHLLPSRDLNFANDLIRKSHAQYSGLSLGQITWVCNLLDRTEPKQPELFPAETVAESFLPLVKLFEVAGAKLKKPRITLRVGEQTIVLAVASPSSSQPGTVNVQTKGSFQDRTWFGRIAKDGSWHPSKASDGRIVETLRALSANPYEFAHSYGRRTGSCCFCGLTLTDHRSVSVGFGPICAEHYGLYDQWSNAVAAASAATFAPAI